MLAYKSGWGEIFERSVRLPLYVIPILGKGFLNVGG